MLVSGAGFTMIPTRPVLGAAPNSSLAGTAAIRAGPSPMEEMRDGSTAPWPEFLSWPHAACSKSAVVPVCCY